MNLELKKDKLAVKGFLIFGFIFFMSIAYVVSDNLIVNGYIQISTLAMTLIFAVFGLLCLFPFLNFDKHYNQYKVSNIKPKKNTNSPKWLKIFGALFFGSFLILINYSGISGHLSDKSLNPSEMISLKGTLSDNVEYLSPAKGSHSLRFKTNEFHDLKFDIGFARDLSFITDYLSKGSKVEILITNHDYQTWIQESKEKDFWDKHEALGLVPVFGLNDSENIYFDLDKYNELIKDDNELGFQMALIIDLIAFIILLVYVIKMKTNANKVYSQ